MLWNKLFCLCLRQFLKKILEFLTWKVRLMNLHLNIESDLITCSKNWLIFLKWFTLYSFISLYFPWSSESSDKKSFGSMTNIVSLKVEREIVLTRGAMICILDYIHNLLKHLLNHIFVYCKTRFSSNIKPGIIPGTFVTLKLLFFPGQLDFNQWIHY